MNDHYRDNTLFFLKGITGNDYPQKEGFSSANLLRNQLTKYLEVKQTKILGITCV